VDQLVPRREVERDPRPPGRSSRGSRHLLTATDGEGWSFFLDAYAPDWSLGGFSDENDLSLAVAFFVSNGKGGASFLSFGDLTPEGEARLAMGSLFPQTS
jgi:hypothetical protein